MKWTRHGKIFDPADHVLPSDCIGFAQSPQVLAFENFVRVYFSTRARDASGKYLSHVAFVEFAPDLREILRVSSGAVISLGALGSFDEHGIFPISVLRHGDAIYGYTCGWSRRVSVPVETGIGLVVSRDQGLTFQRIGDGPIMSASLHEPYLVADGFVRVIDGVFHMWYIFGTSWQRYASDAAPDRTYKIGHAVSRDGISWDREEGRQIITDRLGPEECQALPSVVEIAGRHHMFFCYRPSHDFRTSAGRGYQLGHAWSDDLAIWTRDDDLPGLEGGAGEWDEEMQCYPHAFSHEGRTYLLYNGNEFGRRGFGLAELAQ